MPLSRCLRSAEQWSGQCLPMTTMTTTSPLPTGSRHFPRMGSLRSCEALRANRRWGSSCCSSSSKTASPCASRSSPIPGTAATSFWRSSCCSSGCLSRSPRRTTSWCSPGGVRRRGLLRSAFPPSIVCNRIARRSCAGCFWAPVTGKTASGRTTTSPDTLMPSRRVRDPKIAWRLRMRCSATVAIGSSSRREPPPAPSRHSAASSNAPPPQAAGQRERCTMDRNSTAPPVRRKKQDLGILTRTSRPSSPMGNSASPIGSTRCSLHIVRIVDGSSSWSC
mmetsp:Transcript_32727/g.101204  ORF Transcript_32727/g.101204 Transcript_32727/m.101204 type:complete len:278 (-) Transcript_32727:851-1684(-)